MSEELIRLEAIRIASQHAFYPTLPELLEAAEKVYCWLLGGGAEMPGQR